MILLNGKGYTNTEKGHCCRHAVCLKRRLLRYCQKAARERGELKHLETKHLRNTQIDILLTCVADACLCYILCQQIIVRFSDVVVRQ